MDPRLYEAAMEGNVEVLLLHMNQHMDQLDNQRTPNGNTVLHVAAQFSHLQCVEEITRSCRQLLWQVNNKGETPLHIAAREGYSDIVQALIDRAKQVDQELERGDGAAKGLLRFTNHDEDTALHMAVRNGDLEVVRLLTSEDPEFQHPVNKAEETPLYLAAERGNIDYLAARRGNIDYLAAERGNIDYLAAERRNFDVLLKILDTCTSPTYSGPGGRTALHAIALSNSYSDDSTGRIIERLVDWKQDLIKKVDAYGWTPLHYAVRLCNVELVTKLLEMDKSVGYIAADKDGKKTALHIAAAIGDEKVMEKLLSFCPSSWEMVNSKSQNILHIALEMEEINAIKFIMEKSWLRHLINEKDIEGNTPLHLLAASDFRSTLFELEWHERADRQAFNHNNLIPSELELSTETPGNVVLSINETDREKDEKKREIWGSWPDGGGRNIVSHDQEILIKLTTWKRVRRERCREAEAQKVLENERIEKAEAAVKAKMDAEAEKKRLDDGKRAEKASMRKREVEEMRKKAMKKIGETLLIVATLISTVTFAAGFTLPGGYDGKGMATQVRKVAFKVFVIINTIGLISSASSMFIYVTSSFYIDNEEKIRHRIMAAFYLILIAMIAMVGAFITSACVVLAQSLSLAIAVCVTGCISFPIFFVELRKLGFFNDMRKLLWDSSPRPADTDSKV